MRSELTVFVGCHLSGSTAPTQSTFADSKLVWTPSSFLRNTKISPLLVRKQHPQCETSHSLINANNTVSSAGSLSKFSAGQVYYYPGFTVEKDGDKFKSELAHCLVRESGWEAVMRVRCTKGMRLANFYGNLFLRGPDLLALPTCHADSTFAIEITHSDALLSSTTISVQAALLYTNSGGERRIRVHTICIPVTKCKSLSWLHPWLRSCSSPIGSTTTVFAEVFRSVDIDALCNIMAKNALEVALKTGLDSGRVRLQNQCADIVRAYRNSGAYGANKQGGGYQVQLPESLQLLPLYVVRTCSESARWWLRHVKGTHRLYDCF